jgi:hypothetical protein
MRLAFLPPLLSCALFLPAASCAQAASAGWFDDPDEAFALAAESGRPLLVVFR